jgi:flavin reductase (DIM6/NTAB) family NADH-FMN oxidoreductase RutF
MFYEPDKHNHGLPHNPFKSCCVPRPIGWISTLSPEGVPNLAPFSQFQNVTFDPPYVMFAANQKTVGGRKDTVINAEATGEFVWNMATYAQREAINITAMEVAPEIDEFELAGVGKLPSERVEPWRVEGAPVHFECTYHQTVRLPGNGLMGTADIVIGRVVGVHINDGFITADGRIDVLKARPIARLGYYDYTSIESVFEMVIPGDNETMLVGLEGKSEAAE